MVSDKNEWINELIYTSYRDLPLQTLLKNLYSFFSIHIVKMFKELTCNILSSVIRLNIYVLNPHTITATFSRIAVCNH